MTEEITPTEHKWFIDEGTPGVGDRPAWLPEKYKTAADMAKHTLELEKRLGTVPNEYDFSKSKYLDPDYVPFQELKQVAKDKRVPQEVMDKMLESFDKYMDEFSTDEDEEIRKLGDNAAERLVTLDNWAKANMSADSYKALASNMRNADAIKALEELRGKFMSNTPQIPGNNGTVTTSASVADIKLEMINNFEKYKTDEVYRKDLQNRLEVAAKNTTEYVDKVGA